METHQQDSNFELKKWEIMGQDFVADLCGVVDVLTIAVAYLVDLQGLQVPIWKAVVWFPKVIEDLETLNEKCLSSLQKNLTCIDIDTIFSLLTGSRKQSGYPNLIKEDEFVQYGRDNFKLLMLLIY